MPIAAGRMELLLFIWCWIGYTILIGLKQSHRWWSHSLCSNTSTIWNLEAVPQDKTESRILRKNFLQVLDRNGITFFKCYKVKTNLKKKKRQGGAGSLWGRYGEIIVWTPWHKSHRISMKTAFPGWGFKRQTQDKFQTVKRKRWFNSICITNFV